MLTRSDNILSNGRSAHLDTDHLCATMLVMAQLIRTKNSKYRPSYKQKPDPLYICSHAWKKEDGVRGLIMDMNIRANLLMLLRRGERRRLHRGGEVYIRGLRHGEGGVSIQHRPESSSRSGTRKGILTFPNSKENEPPFDLTSTPFSPYWPAGTYWSLSTSPLDVSMSMSPALWPLARYIFWQAEGRGGGPTSAMADESFSPIRIEVALGQAMEEGLIRRREGRGGIRGRVKGDGFFCGAADDVPSPW